ncbi:alpha/beta hydrolase [Saccharopolyspora sp. MS10]|uniref:alpha/beta hydrolase n=1 Tax=Saccharopolyspora sp. MS10 TaxID=3385973 RepID=UPI0039A1BE90
MAQAEQVAVGGGLAMMGRTLILEPGPMPLAPAELVRQSTAFREARETVAQARVIERTAHERLAAALRSNSAGLELLERAGGWERAAASATSPAAASLAAAAARMDDRALSATRTMIEKAAATGPAAVHGVWSALTGAQRDELADRFPRLVGGTDGVPAAARDRANRSVFAAQRRAVVTELDAARTRLREDFARHGRSDTARGSEIKELGEALRGMDALQAALGPSAETTGYYLLGLDSTAGHRGQVIVAHGNPDLAEHTMTSVPGTFSDLGNAAEYVALNDDVLHRANELSGGRNAVITWTAYQSPDHLAAAAFGGYAADAHADLSRFQEGLRVTHEGPPSHNTLAGHSYGSTVTGTTAAHGGAHADELVFLGSPGVGVDHATELGVPGEHVWAAKSDEDPIDGTPSLNPLDWGPTVFGGTDHARYGVDPTDPAFGGRIMPNAPGSGHNDYWAEGPSRESMARIMTGTVGGRTGAP